MPNEVLLILMTILLYSSVVLFYRFFNVLGLYCWTVLATISANIEVLILIKAFGLEQTLGNILFATTFLVTDILSEIASRQEATRAVNIGIVTSLMFIIISQSWLLYTPNANDWAFPHIQAIFSNTPRVMLSGLIVYAIVQRFDVWLYHRWWQWSAKFSGDRRRYLWLRNNGSTLISQLLNALLFTFGAFYGTYSLSTLLSITWASYVIFIFTSLADTPAVYAARWLKEHHHVKNI